MGMDRSEKRKEKEGVEEVNPDDVLRRMLNTPPDPKPDKSKSDKEEKPAK